MVALGVTSSLPPAQHSRRARRRWGRWVAAVTGAVVVVLATAALMVLLDARSAQANLESASATVRELKTRVLAGDAEAVNASLSTLQEQTAAAVESTSGPHWWLAARVPWAGPSVGAVQTVAAVVDSLATDALPSLAQAVELLDPDVLLPQGGQLNLRPFIEIGPNVVAGDDAVQAAASELARVDTGRVVDRVAAPVEELREMVDELAMTTATASRAAQLLPTMLGAYGQRQYILVTQSPAEIRATGGHTGVWMLVTANDGRIELSERHGGGEFYSETPILPLSADEEELFTDRLVTFGVDAVLTPDFPRAAEIMRAHWLRNEGERVDGVLSVDPVALQHVLGATGPVTLPNGTVLDGTNASQILLNQIYIDEPDPAAHNEFFADAAEAVFDALMEGGIDVSAAIAALDTSADEGRLLVWSADPNEEALLSGTVLSGELRGEDDGTPIVGVYLNDGSATKMSYYLDYSVTVERTQCLAGGVRELSVTVDIASTAPPESSEFPPYLSGGGWLTPGAVQTNVLIYSPAYGWIDSLTVDGAEADMMGFYTHDQMDVVGTTVILGPGESHTIRAVLETGTEQPLPTRVRVTPGARNAEVTVEDSTC